MPKVTFYHSMLCPRCHMAGMSLSRLQAEYPDVEIEKVEYLTNLGRARADGVWTIPSLVADDRRLSGFYLTRSSIRRFLESASQAEREQGLQGAR